MTTKGVLARILVAAILVITQFGATTRSAAALSDAAATNLAPAGPEALAKAWNDAYWIARANPLDFGYPWADTASHDLVVRTTGTRGSSLAAAWMSTGLQLNALRGLRVAPPQVHVRVEPVAQSIGVLDAIQDDATYLVEAGLPDARAIYQSEPDLEHNRVLITTERPSDALVAALVQRYGTRDIVVRVEPNRPKSLPAGRNDDTAAFKGGAQITTPSGASCTSGFAWYTGTNDQLLTAGHCAPTGGNFYTPGYVQYIGYLPQTDQENWTSGVGTVLFPGQSVYRGDVGLINVTSSSGYTTTPLIYTGPNGSSTTAVVKEMWYRSPAWDDNFCTGGYNSGEGCNWRVDNSAPIDHQYSNGEWIRRAWQGYKIGQCILGGDSGGPV